VSRRNRPAKAALSQESIVDAALALLDADGMEAVSMRRVAQALDTGPASLYVYVENRDELLALVLNRVLSEIPLPPTVPGPDWRERLITLIAETITVLGRHGGIAQLAFANVPTGPNALALTETILGLLGQSGIHRQTQAWAMDVLALYIAAAGTEATLYEQRTAGGLTRSQVASTVTSTFAALSPADYPNIADLYPELTSGSSEQRAHWSIDVLLNGILSTPADPGRPWNAPSG
jgi:AcrR family transcriptional regulator